ncbi:MAG: bacteriohemerythrin [Spirochaetaceae bacterium]|jgi:hemerythrin|nr:bacteriohemerythrin [Spirochaetaceae bacterium]
MEPLYSVPENNGIIRWDKRFSVGIPVIDEQHKNLVNLTNELFLSCIKDTDSANDNFKKIVHKLVLYTKNHFSIEERIMETLNFPDIATHKKEHEAFIKQILQGVEDFSRSSRFVPNKFVRYLRDWILAHIAMTDKRYADYIVECKKRRGSGPAAGRMQKHDGAVPVKSA